MHIVSECIQCSFLLSIDRLLTNQYIIQTQSHTFIRDKQQKPMNWVIKLRNRAIVIVFIPSEVEKCCLK